jgi:hypothetical protein
MQMSLLITLFVSQATELPTLSLQEMEAGLNLVSGYEDRRPEVVFVRGTDGWIDIEFYSNIGQLQDIEYRVRRGKVETRTFRVSARRNCERDTQKTRMILDSFSRLTKAGYRSHGYSMWVVKDKIGYLVCWNKQPYRWHDDVTVEYSLATKFENLTRGRG